MMVPKWPFVSTLRRPQRQGLFPSTPSASLPLRTDVAKIRRPAPSPLTGMVLPVHSLRDTIRRHFDSRGKVFYVLQQGEFVKSAMAFRRLLWPQCQVSLGGSPKSPKAFLSRRKGVRDPRVSLEHGLL